MANVLIGVGRGTQNDPTCTWRRVLDTVEIKDICLNKGAYKRHTFFKRTRLHYDGTTGK